MKISVYGDRAKNIKLGQLFIAKTALVEGRDVVYLTEYYPDCMTNKELIGHIIEDVKSNNYDMDEMMNRMRKLWSDLK